MKTSGDGLQGDKRLLSIIPAGRLLWHLSAARTKEVVGGAGCAHSKVELRKSRGRLMIWLQSKTTSPRFKESGEPWL